MHPKAKKTLRSVIRKQLAEDRDVAVSNIEEMAKRANLPIDFPLPMTMKDDRLIEIFVMARRKLRYDPERCRQRGYVAVRRAVHLLGQAARDFQRADEMVGGLCDARTILDRVMQDAPKEDDD